MNVSELIEKLATYNFQCEAGPLILCLDYQKLCVAALLSEAQPPADSSAAQNSVEHPK